MTTTNCSFDLTVRKRIETATLDHDDYDLAGVADGAGVDIVTARAVLDRNRNYSDKC